MLINEKKYYCISFPTHVSCIQTSRGISESSRFALADVIYKLFTIETDPGVYEHFKLKTFDNSELDKCPIDDANGTYMINISNAMEIIEVSKLPDYKTITEEEILKIKEEMEQKEKV